MSAPTTRTERMPPPAARSTARRRLLGDSGLDAVLPYLLLAPTLLLVLAVLVYPLLDGVRTSTGFYRFGRKLRDVGWGNYSQALHDPAFIDSLVTTARFVVLAVLLETVLGLALAMLCAREAPFIRAVRGTLILPMIVTPVVVGIIFRLIYASDVGLTASLARSVGLDPPEILGQPGAAFGGLVLLDVWEWTPLMFLILLAGIQSLPVEPFEAARVDGAGPWRMFVDHTLPMLRPTILIAVTLRSIDALTTFDQVYVLTRGGPGTATQLVSIYGYQTFFQFQQFGYAAAMLIMVALIVIAAAGAAVTLMRRSGP
ncbi:MAG TPA: sugar ABC transporter permease [Kineosporiaceae bacterium]|nr:sugar ABC transporter permease [Kineosporiaceae bacterium]